MQEVLQLPPIPKSVSATRNAAVESPFLVQSLPSAKLMTDNDEKTARAYSLMAMNHDHVWARFAKEEMLALIDHANIRTPIKVIDMGCGSGRHSLCLALMGHKVRAFDFAQAWVERAKQSRDSKSESISESNGTLDIEAGDARCPKAMGGADLVLCLYDIIGSSPEKADATAIVSSLFKLCFPDGWVALSCMNGLQVLRNMPQLTLADPDPQDLEPVRTMQNCGEVFDFSRMLYNPTKGILYRREQFIKDGNIIFDTVIKERRYLPVEIYDLLCQAGFDRIEMFSVRAGKWDFKKPFDPDAPELLFLARRPASIEQSVPKLSPQRGRRISSRGYTLDLIPRDEIEPHHAYIVSRIFCSSFGKNPNTGKLKILGPKKMWERLQRCSYLCLLSSDANPVGYMFGTEYNHLLTKIAWLDSICVAVEHRKKGYATAMLDAFARAVPTFEWLGATSPNPITPLVLQKLALGKIYLSGRPAPSEIIKSLEYICNECEDLRGCKIDPEEMYIKTNFSVQLDANEKEWRKDAPAPAWWTKLANLPEDYESLLIIHRSSISQVGDAD
ncbi:MAG: GNAT family N-acetyltransferase [Candidatus Hydrogenedentes bacterium]|nr:GNAT family N-acetyltransferase [Candidatus Hydrogenedentota bacterium]